MILKSSALNIIWRLLIRLKTNNIIGWSFIGPSQSLVSEITLDRSGPLDVNSGCFSLQMSGDDFGITVYNDTAMKTISVLIVFT